MTRQSWSMLSFALLLAGCASEPPTRIYVLSPPVDDRPSGSTLAGATVLQIRPVVLPDYLDTTDILLRIGTNEIKASPTGRWGERLSQGLDHALAAALVVRLPRDRVELAAASDRSARWVLVTVEAFDVQPDGHSVLKASWRILDPKPDATPLTGSGVFATPAATGPIGDAAIVAAMSQVIGLLADRIAADMEGARS